MMFKLLFLKKLYDLSDERLISSAQTDMAYKYFLGLSPEDKMIDPSLLTKFRKTRITEDILEDLLKETICQAIEKGLVKSGTIIVDATHVEAAVRAKSVPQVLREVTKGLRKEIYKYEYDLSEKFPDKPSLEADVEEEITYTRQLLENIQKGVEQSENKRSKKCTVGSKNCWIQTRSGKYGLRMMRMPGLGIRRPPENSLDTKRTLP